MSTVNNNSGVGQKPVQAKNDEFANFLVGMQKTIEGVTTENPFAHLRKGK